MFTVRITLIYSIWDMFNDNSLHLLHVFFSRLNFNFSAELLPFCATKRSWIFNMLFYYSIVIIHRFSCFSQTIWFSRQFIPPNIRLFMDDLFFFVQFHQQIQYIFLIFLSLLTASFINWRKSVQLLMRWFVQSSRYFVYPDIPWSRPRRISKARTSVPTFFWSEFRKR